MAKKRTFTNIGEIEQSLQSQTKQLYEQTPTAIPTPSVPSILVPDVVVVEKKKKPISIIPKTSAKCIYFEESHNEAVERIHWICKADRQDIVRTALEYFLQQFYSEGELSDEGKEVLNAYFEKTHIYQ